jgi:TRAP transporter TAXI family solute receptor
MKKLILIVLALFISACAAPVERQKFVVIVTGGVKGVYYPTGGAICKLVNKKRRLYGIRCSIESTGGSIFNINAVMAGDSEFGMAQSDRQYQAWSGLNYWRQKGPQRDLRAVFSIYSEMIFLVAAVDSGIETIQDLRGKRVNIGNPRSFNRSDSIVALTNAGIDYEKDLTTREVKGAEAPGLLQDGHIDAFFYTISYPSSAIKEATSGKRKVRFIPITDTEDLIKKYPYYAKAFIPINHYPRVANRSNVQTFGLKVTLITSAAVPEEWVYNITKEIFDNFEKFKRLHPAYQLITKESMLEALSAPIHPGALKYYKEVGLK